MEWYSIWPVFVKTFLKITITTGRKRQNSPADPTTAFSLVKRQTAPWRDFFFSRAGGASSRPESPKINGILGEPFRLGRAPARSWAISRRAPGPEARTDTGFRAIPMAISGSKAWSPKAEPAFARRGRRSLPDNGTRSLGLARGRRSGQEPGAAWSGTVDSRNNGWRPAFRLLGLIAESRPQRGGGFGPSLGPSSA